MNPCALATSDVSGLSCLSCPFARCLPSLLWVLSLLVVGSALHVGGVVSVEQLVVQVVGGVQSLVHDGGLQFEVHVPVGVLPVPPLLLLLLVLPPPLLEACSAGPCRRKGTRKAPIPATIRAMAPTLRFVDESISLFSCLPFLGVEQGLRGVGI